MLKHPEITRRRIDAFYQSELRDRLIVDRAPLSLEIADVCASTPVDAASWPWQPAAPGLRYGPAYRAWWFRVRGRTPERFLDWEVQLAANVGGERTIWRGGQPVWGLDAEHEGFIWPGAWGPEVDVMIEAVARNPQCRVHGHEPPREELVETVQGAELLAFDRELANLAYDVAFARNLLSAIDEADPNAAVLLRGLNAVANTFQRAERGTIARCRKIVRDTLGSLTGELRHAVTAVGHSHLDTAWLWPIAVTKRKMAHTTATQLSLMERYPEFVFAHSQASQYEWLEREYPALFERVKAAIAAGRWEPVGSMWVEADCNLTGGESLVRQFLYGRRYFRETLGVETGDMWLPDVFGYSAALPQILDKFGIRYFLTQKISWNQTNRFPHNTFWWQGIDGTRVWAHFPPADTYIGSGEPSEILRSVRNHQDHARSDASLYLFGFGDGGGGPTERHIELLRRARLAPCTPEIHLGRRAADFFSEARAHSRDLAVWVGELYLEFHRGTFTSQAASKKANRQSEFLLRDAEWLSCFRPHFPVDYPAGELEEAWKLVLLNQFHDILPGSSVREVYEDSARDYEVVHKVTERIISESLLAIAGRIDSADCTRPVALFHNATVRSQGEIPWTEDEAPSTLVCGEETLPVQVVEEFGERKLIFPIPAAAAGAVAIADLTDDAHAQTTHARLKSGARRLESHEFSVRFDAHGNLAGIQSLEDGTEFLEPGKLGNLFQLFEDQPLFWSAWDIDPYALETGRDLVRSESFEIVERGPVRVAAEVVKKFGASHIRQRISLGPTPGIRFDTEIEWHEENQLLKVAFPVNVHSSRATFDIQFGNVERPTHQNTSWDLARFEVCAHKWVDLSEGDQGVALINDCKYGHDVVGNVMRLTLLRAPKAPDPICDMGRHRFTYVLLPHFGGVAYGGVVAAGYAVNTPLRHASLAPHRGVDGALPMLAACDDRNVVVETVKRSEDGRAIIVRLYECHNSRGRAELSCARPIRRAALCDLEENELAELEIVEGGVRFAYKPFEILTILLDI